MLGKVRASSMSSLELLEMERPPSKIVKHDSLSIYESTLLKLKQGSRCDPSCNQENSAQMDTCCTVTEEAMISDASCCSAYSFPAPASNFQSACSSKEPSSKSKSIGFLFSKYKSSKETQMISSGGERMDVMSCDYSSTSSSISSASSS